MRIPGFIVVISSFLLRKGMVSVLNHIRGLRVLKEFDSVSNLSGYLSIHPVDYIMMGQDCFEASASLFLEHPELLEKVILLKTEEDSAKETQASILLSDDKETVIGKITSMLNQQQSPEKAERSMKLSPRETTIVRLVSMGLTNKQIAEQLFLSAHTVMTHRKNISSKLGIKSVSGLTVYAIVNNIITIEEVSSNPPQ